MLKFDKDVAEYVHAAHPPLMLRKAATGNVHALRYRDGEYCGGSFLGMQALEGPFTSLRFRIEPGDVLLLFTDELNEETDTANEQYGLERIMDSLTRAPAGSARTMLDFILAEFTQFTHPKTRAAMT
jgi:sigma-B regulation protein RsbU (phosphoserine phosphatase)